MPRQNLNYSLFSPAENGKRSSKAFPSAAFVTSQMFWTSYARSHCDADKEERLISAVNAVVRNLYGFKKDFKCPMLEETGTKAQCPL
jgi:hypothetical protein